MTIPSRPRCFPFLPLCLCLLLVMTGGCSYLFYPRADDYLHQAQGSTAPDTILNLADMLEASAHAARSSNYQSAMDDLHNQLHALDEAYGKLNKEQAHTPAYVKATTLRKELWTIFKPLWWRRDDHAVRQAQLDLLTTRLKEVREVVQSLRAR